MKSRKGATLDEVAKGAGVSRSTAALVLREGNLITAATKQKVLESAEKLGYIPRNQEMVRVPDKSANIIGVSLPDIGNIFFDSLFIGINEFFDQYENYTIFFNSHFDRLGKQQSFLENVLKDRVAGLIIAPSLGTTREEMERIRGMGIPMVFATRTIEGMDIDYVGGDNKAGAYEATRHLIEKNHRRIALLGGTEGITPLQDRRDGYHRALQECGIPFDESLMMAGPVKREWGCAAIKEILKLPDPPTAVICYNDIIANGVIEGLGEMNLVPGEDIAVIKFDYAVGGRDKNESDISAVQFNSLYYSSRSLFPNFTTVRSDVYQWGYEAAKLLFRHIVGLSTKTEKIIFPQNLIIRQSSTKAF